MENVTQLFLEAEWEYISSNEMYDIYFDISNSLRKKEQELKEREKKDSAQIFGLLAKATSMSLVNSINEPYKAYIENFQTGQRSTIPDDFTIDDLASFESLLTVVTEPLLKARLADLLWLLHKPRNPEHARIVIDLYFLCEIDEETWLKGVNNYVSRAIQLSLQLKDYDRLDIVRTSKNQYNTDMSYPIHFRKKISVHDKFHRTLILSGFCLLKIAKISLNSSFFPKPIKR